MYLKWPTNYFKSSTWLLPLARILYMCDWKVGSESNAKSVC